MRKFILFFSSFIFLCLYSYASIKPTVKFFHSPTCKICLKVKEEVLPKVVTKYQDKVSWEFLNVQNKENLLLLVNISEQFKRKGSYVPSVLVGDTFLVGYDEIKNNLDKAILKALRTNTTFNFSITKNILDLFKNFSVFTVALSGLADGINPCAFAVIVFFISFLTVYGYSRKEVIFIGLFYCIAVFLTYLLIGLGFFNFLYSAKNIYFFIKVFYFVVAFICFVFSGFSFLDSLKFRQSADSKEIILKLPDFLKKRINIVIGKNLRQKNKNLFILGITSFIVGLLVSLLEAACTGQVYVPTIVFILKYTPYRLKAFGYLLLYNLAFIFPLIIVFLLSLFGISSQRFNIFLQKNLSLFKIILAIVFFLLGIFIIWDEIIFAINYYAKLSLLPLIKRLLIIWAYQI